MKRECRTCEWSRPPGMATNSKTALRCYEGPVTVMVHNTHWCGRWRLSEAEIQKGPADADG